MQIVGNQISFFRNIFCISETTSNAIEMGPWSFKSDCSDYRQSYFIFSPILSGSHKQRTMLSKCNFGRLDHRQFGQCYKNGTFGSSSRRVSAVGACFSERFSVSQKQQGCFRNRFLCFSQHFLWISEKWTKWDFGWQLVLFLAISYGSREQRSMSLKWDFAL